MAKKTQNTQVNEIDEAVKESFSFVEKYKKAIIYGGGGLLVLIIACLLLHQFYWVPRTEEAAEKIAAAEQLFRSGDYDKALNGNGQDAGFLQIIDEYGNTKSGNIANLYAGLCYVQKEKYQDAVKYLESYDDCGDEMVSNAAIGALGNCYAELGQNDKAAETLCKAAEKADNNTLSPIFLIQAGQLYETLNQKDKAQECYEKVKNDYPNSMQRQEIDKYIERLK